MRYSKQREQILELVKTVDCHPTADWVYQKMREILPNISLGTVYRNLGQLVDKNLIRCCMVAGVAHYDGDLTDHQHFYCINCHNLYDLNLPLDEFISEMESDMEHEIQGYDFQLMGVCAACQ